jgi:hypothetical protein
MKPKLPKGKGRKHIEKLGESGHAEVMSGRQARKLAKEARDEGDGTAANPGKPKKLPKGMKTPKGWK